MQYMYMCMQHDILLAMCVTAVASPDPGYTKLVFFHFLDSTQIDQIACDHFIYSIQNDSFIVLQMLAITQQPPTTIVYRYTWRCTK